MHRYLCCIQTVYLSPMTAFSPLKRDGWLSFLIVIFYYLLFYCITYLCFLMLWPSYLFSDVLVYLHISHVIRKLKEYDMLPDDLSEIPKRYSHLKDIVGQIPAPDSSADILILLGRVRHKVRQHYKSPHNAPYAQCLDLGWIIIGEVCLGKAHKPSRVDVYWTSMLGNGHFSSILAPAVSSSKKKLRQIALAKEFFRKLPTLTSLPCLWKVMYRDDSNSWASLPFKEPRRKLSNNREQAVKHLMTSWHMAEKSQNCSRRKSLH